MLLNALPIDAPSWSLRGEAFSAMERCSFAGWECFRSFPARADSPAPGSEGTGEWGAADGERSDSISLEVAGAGFRHAAELAHWLPRSVGESAMVLGRCDILLDCDLLGEGRRSGGNAPTAHACAVGSAEVAARRTLGEDTAAITIDAEWVMSGRYVVAARSPLTFRDGTSGARQGVPSTRAASPNTTAGSLRTVRRREQSGRPTPRGSRPTAQTGHRISEAS